MAISLSNLDTMAEVNANVEYLLNQQDKLSNNLTSINTWIDNQLDKMLIDANEQFLNFIKTVPIFKNMSFSTAEEALTQLQDELNKVRDITFIFNDKTFLTDIISAYQQTDNSITEKEIENILNKLINYYGRDRVDKIISQANFTSEQFGSEVINHIIDELFPSDGKLMNIEILVEDGGTTFQTIKKQNWNILGNAKTFTKLEDYINHYIKQSFGASNKKGKQHIKISKLHTIGMGLDLLTAKEQNTLNQLDTDLNIETTFIEGNPSYFKTWGEIVQSKKASEINIPDEILLQQNNLIKDAIFHGISQQLPADQIDNFNQVYYPVINNMLAVNPKLFYVGKNYNDITGLMGELQTGMYLKILGFENATWVAQETHSGKQYSADWMTVDNVLGAFGIQVKNSVWGNENISFGQLTFENMSDILLNATGIPGLDKIEEVIHFVEDIMLINQFNIMYQKINGKATPATNKQFGPTREKIEKQLLPAAMRILRICSSVMLHIQTQEQIGENLKGINSNVLYIVNGAAHSAGEMIQNIINNSDAFKVNSSLTGSQKTDILNSKLDKDGNGVGTIVDWINQGHNLNNIKQNVRLTSSYNFGI